MKFSSLNILIVTVTQCVGSTVHVEDLVDNTNGQATLLSNKTKLRGSPTQHGAIVAASSVQRRTVMQGTCVGDRSTYDAGWGKCDTYDDHNSLYCDQDTDDNGILAEDACSECGKCTDSLDLDLLDGEDVIYEDVPDMSNEEITRVMDWIKAEVTMVKLPFCWRDSYGRGVGTIPGRVADCPPSYTNNGATCGRGTDDISAPSKLADCPSGYTNNGLTCGRGTRDISAPSKLANCPAGYVNHSIFGCHRPYSTHGKSGCCFLGACCCGGCNPGYYDAGCFCARDAHSIGPSNMECPAGYFLNKALGTCHKECPSGYTNMGETCHRPVSTRGASSMTCPNGYFQSSLTARCHKECPAGYTNTGEFCHRPVSTLLMSSMICKDSEERIGARCFPVGGSCFNNEENDAGLCYSKCDAGYSGVGPVCWSQCDGSQVNCGAACAKTSADCATTTVDQVFSTLVLAANIASLGLTSGASAGANAGAKMTINAGGKVLVGTSKAGKAFVKVVNKLQSIKPDGLKKGATIIQRISHARTGTVLKQVTLTAKLNYIDYKTTKQFREAVSDDFSTITSQEINAELDSHFNPTTAAYLKGAWADIQLQEMSAEYGWQIAQTTLAAASIVDITGVTGVISAYAKPTCSKLVPFPCTNADNSGCARTTGQSIDW